MTEELDHDWKIISSKLDLWASNSASELFKNFSKNNFRLMYPKTVEILTGIFGESSFVEDLILKFQFMDENQLRLVLPKISILSKIVKDFSRVKKIWLSLSYLSPDDFINDLIYIDDLFEEYCEKLITNFWTFIQKWYLTYFPVMFFSFSDVRNFNKNMDDFLSLLRITWSFAEYASTFISPSIYFNDFLNLNNIEFTPRILANINNLLLTIMHIKILFEKSQVFVFDYSKISKELILKFNRRNLSYLNRILKSWVIWNFDTIEKINNLSNEELEKIIQNWTLIEYFS